MFNCQLMCKSQLRLCQLWCLRFSIKRIFYSILFYSLKNIYLRCQSTIEYCLTFFSFAFEKAISALVLRCSKWTLLLSESHELSPPVVTCSRILCFRSFSNFFFLLFLQNKNRVIMPNHKHHEPM